MNRIDIIRELVSGISTESLADILRERGYEVRPARKDHETFRIVPVSEIIDAMTGDDPQTPGAEGNE